MFGEKTCGRCGLPNINPDTGKPNPKAEPFNTLYKLVFHICLYKFYVLKGVNSLISVLNAIARDP